MSEQKDLWAQKRPKFRKVVEDAFETDSAREQLRILRESLEKEAPRGSNKWYRAQMSKDSFLSEQRFVGEQMASIPLKELEAMQAVIATVQTTLRLYTESSLSTWWLNLTQAMKDYTATVGGVEAVQNALDSLLKIEKDLSGRSDNSLPEG